MRLRVVIFLERGFREEECNDGSADRHADLRARRNHCCRTPNDLSHVVDEEKSSNGESDASYEQGSKHARSSMMAAVQRFLLT